MSTCIAQNIGISLGYSSANAVFGDAFYLVNGSSFHIGYTYELNDATGKEVSEQKSNYGRTVNYFSSIDLGYGYNILDRIMVNIEISFATKKYYTNYVDGRFSGGGYHMISKDESQFGIGGFVGYNFNDFDFFIGYNSVRKAGFGLRYIFKI